MNLSMPSKSQAADWNKIFRFVDPAIDAFAEEKELRVTRWRWEFPNRVLSPRKRIYQSIQVAITGDPPDYFLEVSWATHNKSEIFDKLKIPQMLEDSSEFLTLRGALREYLIKAYDTLLSL